MTTPRKQALLTTDGAFVPISILVALVGIFGTALTGTWWLRGFLLGLQVEVRTLTVSVDAMKDTMAELELGQTDNGAWRDVANAWREWGIRVQKTLETHQIEIPDPPPRE